MLFALLQEGWGAFDSWSDIDGFSDWLLQLVRSIKPYHTLLHIAFLTVWTYIPMTMGWRVRVGQLVLTAVIHTILLSSFYFRWIHDYGLDEGGYVSIMLFV